MHDVRPNAHAARSTSGRGGLADALGGGRGSFQRGQRRDIFGRGLSRRLAFGSLPFGLLFDDPVRHSPVPLGLALGASFLLLNGVCDLPNAMFPVVHFRLPSDALLRRALAAFLKPRRRSLWLRRLACGEKPRKNKRDVPRRPPSLESSKVMAIVPKWRVRPALFSTSGRP